MIYKHISPKFNAIGRVIAAVMCLWAAGNEACALTMKVTTKDGAAHLYEFSDNLRWQVRDGELVVNEKAGLPTMSFPIENVSDITYPVPSAVDSLRENTDNKISFDGKGLKVESAGAIELRVFAADGKIVKETHGQNSCYVDVEELPGGIYMATVTTANGKNSLKIILR